MLLEYFSCINDAKLHKHAHIEQFFKGSDSGAVQPGSILGRATPDIVHEEVVTSSLEVQRWGEVQRHADLYQYNGSGGAAGLLSVSRFREAAVIKERW